jgi:hypothetical protein
VAERRWDLRITREDFRIYASLPDSDPQILWIIDRVKRAKRAFVLRCTGNELLSLHRALLDEAHAATDRYRLDAVLRCLATVEFQLRLASDPKTPEDFLESVDISSAIDSYIEKYRQEIVSTTKREIGLSRTLGRRADDPPSESNPKTSRE